MANSFRTACLFVATIALGGCEEPVEVNWMPAGEQTARPEVEPTAINASVAAANQFGIDMLRQSGADGNAVISPWSLNVALRMVWAGATGQTADQIADVLHVGDLDPALVHDTTGVMIQQMDQRVAGAELRTANAGFTSIRPNDGFVDLTVTRYRSDWGVMSFTEPSRAAKAINRWVAEQTDNRIGRLIHSGDLSTVTQLVLVSATYLNAKWQEPFPEHLTGDGRFHVNLKRTVTVDVMHHYGHSFDYTETDAVQVIRLPYEGGTLSMVVVLPRATDGLADVEAALSAEQLSGWMAAMSRQGIEKLALPRFEMRTHTNVVETLKALGMVRAFDGEQAEFADLSAEPLVIQTIAHEAWLRVDEEGTEAAAATVAGMKSEMGGSAASPVRFIADHPFLYLIRHEPTGAILFLGRVSDPTVHG